MVEAPNAKFTHMNEEHGYVDIRETVPRFGIGERLHVVRNHICPRVNLHDDVHGMRGYTIERVWTVAARGKLE
jgi:D-serine deaminase-like pyridoxal phosphate-dependent protein